MLWAEKSLVKRWLSLLDVQVHCRFYLLFFCAYFYKFIKVASWLTTTLLFVLLYLTFINVTWMFEDYKLCPSKGILLLKTSNLCFRIQTLMENIYYWSFLLWSVQVICNIWMYNYVFNPAWEHAITYNGKLWGHETLGVLEHLISAEKKNTATKTF